ncbi:MAG: DUF2231 domain-containing protein [Acidobacteriota bacterium]|nr:DUF2231 domain-containing protein [Acidobacteriota bacterium]MDH3785802.1 DUF2231 domain-containing protein [Acidobacteriota bacterium]
MLRWFHPAVVHFSIAFLAAGGAVGCLGYLSRRPRWIRVGHQLLAVGSLCLLPTLVTGYLAANSVTTGAVATELLADHEVAGWILTGCAAITLLWLGSYRGEIPAGQRNPFAIWLAILVSAVLYAALLGGKLVYIYQVGTGA